jgi:hypothetical protein
VIYHEKYYLIIIDDILIYYPKYIRINIRIHILSDLYLHPFNIRSVFVSGTICIRIRIQKIKMNINTILITIRPYLIRLHPYLYIQAVRVDGPDP